MRYAISCRLGVYWQLKTLLDMIQTHNKLETNALFHRMTQDDMQIFKEFPLHHKNKYIFIRKLSCVLILFQNVSSKVLSDFLLQMLKQPTCPIAEYGRPSSA